MSPFAALRRARHRHGTGAALVFAGLFLVLTAVPLVFSPQIYDNFTLPKQAVLLLSAALVLTGFAISGELLPRGRMLRIAVVVWAAILVLSLWQGIDPRGSLLGTYQYRQGFLTQAAYLVLFLGALALGRRDAGRKALPLCGLLGLLGVTIYAGMQVTGRDPVGWWIDTSDRAISTIGNANELGAFAVIGLAFAGVFAARRPAVEAAGFAAVAAAAVFVVIAAGSRSGLVALVVVAAMFPILSWIAVRQRRALLRQAAALAAGGIAGLLLSLLAGSGQHTTDRVQAGVRTSDPSGSTRVELWKGTLATVAAAPLLGFGPDGLYLAFPRHRPELHGAFDDYELVAQSSHNAVLDVAANTGIAGVIALATLLAAAAVPALRAQRSQPDPGFALGASAVAGYAAMTMINPLSLAPHAIFWVLLGLYAGRGDRAGARTATTALPQALRAGTRASAVAAALALCTVAALLPAADLAAARGWDAYASGRFVQASRQYATARGRLPIVRRYPAEEARALLAAGAEGDRTSLEAAERRLRKFDDDFGLAASEAVDLATSRIGLGLPAGQTLPVIERAIDLNPHGAGLRMYEPVLRRAAAQGGFLVYSQRDRWVFIVPAAATPDTALPGSQ